MTFGQVVLGAAAPLRPGFGTGTSWGAMILHELGHVLGLGHVNDPSQVMHPTVTSVTRPAYQGGDRAGLSALGYGRC